MSDQARAFSIDGRHFDFESPLDEVFPLGGFVEISNGPLRYLGQVLGEQAAAFDPQRPQVTGSGLIVASLEPGGTVTGPPSEGFAAATIDAADPAAVAAFLERGKPGRSRFTIGMTRPVAVPATLHGRGFSRHTFVCGQSGSGKTYSMGVFLERLLTETGLRIVVLDPNSDFVHLGRTRTVEEVGIPEADQRAIRGRLAAVEPLVQLFGGDVMPLRVRFGRLSFEQQAMVTGLDRLADAEEFDVARRIVREFGSRDYGLDDLRNRAAELDEPAARRLQLRIDNLGLLGLDLWASRAEEAVGANLAPDWRALIVDLGSLTTARERSIVSAGLLTVLWERRHERHPTLLVIDEAHNVCPQQPTDPSQALGTDTLISIAGEGRKFGLFLMLATQRPQKVHENVLTQCGNLVLMKMNAVTDIRALSNAFSFVPPSLIEMSSGFGLGEGLVAGPITNGPMLFKTGERYTPEGGADVPATWDQPPG